MKKILTKIIPTFVLAVTLCLAIALSACGAKDIEFKGETQIGNLPVVGTLLLKSDNTCEYSVFIDTENEQFKSFEDRLKASGTWEMSGDEYKVTFGSGENATTITSSHSGSQYTLVYSMMSEFGPKPITLTYTK